MVSTKRNGNGTLITLIKYEDYQGMRNGKRNSNGTQAERQRNACGHKQYIKKHEEDIIKKEEESEQEISDEQAREWGWID